MAAKKKPAETTEQNDEVSVVAADGLVAVTVGDVTVTVGVEDAIALRNALNGALTGAVR